MAPQGRKPDGSLLRNKDSWVAPARSPPRLGMSSNGSLKRPREGDDEAAAGTARPAAMPRIEGTAGAAPAGGAVGVPQGGQPMINFPQVGMQPGMQ